jgi:hypothetical protein
MKARSAFTALAVLAGAVSSAADLIACASDESPTFATPDASNTVPTLDAASDALPDAELDAATPEDLDPCVPDALCPNGPFGATVPDGGLDVRVRINVIRGRSANDVWAAGAHGAIAHFDGATWTRSVTDSAYTMKGLWLRDSEEIALVSLSSIYTRGLDASAGTPPSADGWTVRGMPSGPFEIYMSANRITGAWTAPDAEWLFFTTLETPPPRGPGSVNGIWRLRVSPTTNALEITNAVPPNTCATLPCKQVMSIHGAAADDVWAVGFTGSVVHITDAQSAQPKAVAFDSQTWASLNGVWAASTNDVWAVGGGGVIRHYTGQPTSWDIVANVPATETLNAVWGSSASDVWAVGDGATVLHYDGTSWSRVKVAGLGDRRPDLYSVWTPAPGHVWVGGDGVILSLGGKP